MVELTAPQMVAMVSRVVMHRLTRAGVAWPSTNSDSHATSTTAMYGMYICIK